MNGAERDAQAMVERAFGAELDEMDDAARWDALRAFLVVRLRDVIDRNFGQLPHLLYQVDVPERRVNRVFKEARTADEVPTMLAELVLERAREIAAARADYERRQKGSHDDGQ